MRLTSMLFASVLIVGSSDLYAGQPPASLIGSTATFRLDNKTQVPGSILKSGDYSIRIVDQLPDRMIIRLDSSAGKDHSLFLAVAQLGSLTQNVSGPVIWKSALNGTPALRGFQFSSGSTVEFVYPKAQAAALAQLNGERVVAVDPDSEGRPVLQKMSQDDLQEVTLWMLSLTTASPRDKTPALLAQRYQPSPDPNKPSGTTVASNPTPKTTQVASLEQPSAGPSAASPAPVRHQRAVAQLPHTASQLPLIWMVGFLSLLSGAVLRLVRITRGVKE